MNRPASASDLYWDADGDATGNATSGTNLGGATGVWDTAGSSNWWDGSSASNTVWNDGNNAIFTGTPGNVIMIGAKAVSGIDFQSDGYNGEDNGVGSKGGTVNLDVTNATINTASGVTGQLNARLVGSGTVTKTGDGTLILNNTSARVGGFPTASSEWTSNINVSAGTLQIGGHAFGYIGPDPNQFNASNGPQVFPVIDLAAGTTLNFATQNGSASGANLLPVAVSGQGNVIVSGNSSAITIYGNSTYTGTTTINADSHLRLGAGSGPGGAMIPSGRLGNTAITNNGVMEWYNQEPTSDFPGTLSGPGTVIFRTDQWRGTTYVLTGASTPGGLTTITDDTSGDHFNDTIVQIGNGGATGSWDGPVAIDNANVLQFNRSGSLSHNQPITQGAGTGGRVNVIGSGTVTFGGASSNTYSGLTSVSGGELDLAKTAGTAITGPTKVSTGATLALVSPNQIDDGSAMELAGGTFATNGKPESLGTLTVSDNSTLDLGAANVGVLAFADSSSMPWASGKLLSVSNWGGDAAGGGLEQLKFDSSNAALTSGQLAQIQFLNPAGFAPGTYAAAFSGSNPGEVVPTPEPGSIALLGLGSLALLRRRRRA
jgi:autotransporter-associated beta strand protein